jgi:hypothetical protein
MMRFRRKFFFKALLMLVMIALLGWVVMHLWNWVIPGLFADAQAIDYPRALGLLLLSRILFGGFRAGGFGGYRGCRGRQWARWQHLTQEERDALRSGMRAPSGEQAEGGR